MRVVLHICCGVCAAGVAERLISEGHEVLGLFHNPNIHPQAEYERRLEVASRVARELHFPLEVTPYVPEEWLAETRSLQSEPEGGKRCAVCFRLRLQKAYDYLEDCKWDAFTTTLTVSRDKAAAVVNKIGQEIGGDRFLVRDFKKKGGSDRAIELAKQWSLYRQDYCGCLYSQRSRTGSPPMSRSL